MNTYFRPTVVFIVAVICVIAVYDVWAVVHSYQWTISSTMLQAARDWPVIPFLLGLLFGHLFFPNRAAGTGPKS